MKVVRPYDPAWARAFERESGALRECLGATLVAVHHIGSTAIPGLAAKPIIDILGEVTALDGLDARNAALEQLGYQVRGAYGIEGRRYFSKPASKGALGVHAHLFQRGSAHIVRHLCFRDYLRIKPELAREYGALKFALADAEGVLVADYVERKAAFVQRVERLALVHFSSAGE